MDLTRTRTSRACDGCRRRKLKCLPGLELNDPRCIGCVQKNITCTYNISRRQGGPKTGRIIRELQASQRPLDDPVIESPHLPRQAPNSETSLSSSLNLDLEGSTMFTPVMESISSNRTLATWNDSLTQAAGVIIPDPPPTVASPSIFDIPAISHRSIELPFSREELLAEISNFFNTGFGCYPILNLDTMIQRTERMAYVLDIDFYVLLLSIVAINEAMTFKMCPGNGASRLDSLLESLEGVRMRSGLHDFAQTPSLDTVTTSWLLFMTNHFRGHSNRAFVYLAEAIELLDMVDLPSDPLEQARMRRLERILYVTESGAVSLYGSERKRRIARRPVDLDTPVCSEFLTLHKRHETLDRKALDLLLLMTRLHAAVSLAEVAEVNLDRQLYFVMQAAPSPPGSITEESFLSVQMADVAITRQWRLALFWQKEVDEQRHLYPNKAVVGHTIEVLGTTIMQWSRMVLPDQLRLINLRKIVASIQAIVHIASCISPVTNYSNLIGGLIQVVSEVDYEGNFGPELSLCDVVINNVPRLIPASDDEDYWQIS